MFPEPIKNFINIFSKLPSIGPRQATRLAFYLISSGKNKLKEASKAITYLETIKICSNCFFIHSNSDNLCNICRDENRKKDLIMVVEKETDLTSIERTKKFTGRYLVLGELTKNGILDSSHKLRLNVLKNYIKKLPISHSEPQSEESDFLSPEPVEGKHNQAHHVSPKLYPASLKLCGGEAVAQEIIIATNPTTYGDLNAMIIRKELEGFAKKFSRLGRGIPTGGEIEFADEETLEQALERRN